MVEVSWQTPPLYSECDYLVGVWDLRRVVVRAFSRATGNGRSGLDGKTDRARLSIMLETSGVPKIEVVTTVSYLGYVRL